VPEPESTTPPKKRRWTFLRKFRWTVYIVFIALMAFMAVCTIAGIVGNLHERYRDLDIPVDRPESLSDLGSLQLRDCLTALKILDAEQQAMAQKSFTGELERDAFLSQWKDWSADWRRRFETLGVSCRLTEYRYDEHPTLGTLAGIYRRLEELHKVYTTVVRQFVMQNARMLSETRSLFSESKNMIERIEAQPAP
jgi:hypothetical protein